MLRDQLSDLIREHETEIRERGVTGLALFGSMARGEEGPRSDVDIVVDIDPNRRLSLFDLSGLRLFFCDLFGREADVVIRKNLRPRFREKVSKEEFKVL